MVTSNYKATPLSNSTIANLAKKLRSILGFSDTCYIDVLQVLEVALPQMIDGFKVLIKDHNDMPVNTHAYTDHDNNCIVIRGDIYDRAYEGHGRDRLTIAHEIAHLLLHDNKLLVMSRTYFGEKIKTYEDPEWQATAFAGEFLCPAKALKKLSHDEITEKYGVSLDAARRQKAKGEKI